MVHLVYIRPFRGVPLDRVSSSNPSPVGRERLRCRSPGRRRERGTGCSPTLGSSQRCGRKPCQHESTVQPMGNHAEKAAVDGAT